MKTILTGDRTTGKLHIGHYLGTLENRVKLQDSYKTFVMLADVQALTDNYQNPGKVHDAVFQVAIDNLSVGLDPDKSTLFIQSLIPELAELTVYFMNLVSLSRLQRNPTVKDEMQQKGFGTNIPVGFLNYPISQAADILGFQADLVPVGKDQSPMLEQTREIAKKFNDLYGKTFVIPEILLGRVSKLVGTDGNNKMSKSLGNIISLSDSSEQVRKQVKSMYTDPNRITKDVPGNVSNNPVFIYLDALSKPKHLPTIDQFKNRYLAGGVGDVEVKDFLFEVIEEFLEPIRAKRKELELNPELINKILKSGTEKARQEVQKTLAKAKKNMNFSFDNF
ncbi:MAG TPA: tryptophan--tRNA ligase [Candidatus Dormibacteraeota bacterium]|nr:tryptophan--tRNA ligase [Candidatus Dormibacteraeota bacterium]